MAEFNQSFFEDEIRDGFYVRSDMKRIWAANIEVLAEIDRICKKYDISWYADFGTLLGAVRHNGYIPWDDDLDIVMFREDYMKFLSVANRELKAPMRCANIYQSDSWTLPFARVASGVGINLDRQYMEQFHGCVYTAGVDIFVLDNMPESEEEYYLIGYLYGIVQRVRDEIKKEKEDSEKEEDSRIIKEKPEDWLDAVEEICKVKIDREKNIQNQLLRIIDGLGALNAVHQNEEIFDICFISHLNYFHAGGKREWYRETVYLPFENITVPAPVDFHKVLEYEYGDYRRAVKTFEHTTYSELENELQTVLKKVKSVNERIKRVESL